MNQEGDVRGGSDGHVGNATIRENGSERIEEERRQKGEPERSELGQGFEVERMSVERPSARGDVTRSSPVERERSRPRSEERVRGVLVVPGDAVVRGARLRAAAVDDDERERE